MSPERSVLGVKIIFMGTPDYADEILKEILKQENMEVVAIFTQPDKPVGRKRVLTPPIVKVTAQENKIPIFQPNRLRDEEVIKEVINIECDFIVVAAYGQILPQEILDHAPCINLHASILPQYRGASPIQQSLLNDDKKSGVTAMLMDIGLDTGDILKISTIEIDKNMMVNTLFDKLTKIASNLTIDVLNNYNKLIPQKQVDKEATHCKKIAKADGEVNFDSATVIYNKYRAFTPWPGIFLCSGLKLKSMKLYEDESKNEAGKILKFLEKSIVVGCKRGSLELFTIQPPSKKEINILDYLNGQRLNVADTLI
ncbi:MAG: methionyl-tRNA formyltransferase [Helicobacteraceae bacterium]|nr:methionyl-tRNA formyltransferase [Helicobacteraceae bacterium]